MENLPKLANKIKRLRDARNLSQERFGKKIGLTGKTISAYETGRTTPPLKILEKIVNVYDAPLVKINNSQKESLREKLTNLEKEIISIKDMLEEGLSL